MQKAPRHPLLATVLPMLIVIVCGCSQMPVEAAPLNVTAINGIRAYHLTFAATVHYPNNTLNATMTEDVVVPDRARGVSTESLDGKTITANAVKIGDRVWIKTDTDWQEQSIDPSALKVSTNASMQVCTAFRDLPARTESFKGKRAVHYSSKGASTAALEAAFQQFSGAFKMLGSDAAGGKLRVVSADLWTTADGAHPLRFKLELTYTVNGEQTTEDAQADYSDIDGSDIDIEPPI